MQITAVRLQMDDSVGFKEIAVSVHEERGGEALLLTSDLRVSKGDPYFRDLIPGEKRLYEFDASAQETYIPESVFLSIFGPFPQTRSLDVYADIVA